MPGSPDPVLGSVAATIGVSIAVAGIVAAIPFLRDERRPPKQWALGGGLGYALLCLGAWAGARWATDSLVSSLVEQPASLVGLLILGAIVLGAQAAIPIYLHARWGLVVPLVGLFGATYLVLFAFLQVRGESDPLALYALFFGPLIVGLIGVIGLVELGIRRAIAASRK